jgi:serine/threonine protein kinase
MNTEHVLDENLQRSLPLPLAQLYRRAHNAKTPLERHLTAYYAWEAALKLLGAVALAEYAELTPSDPLLDERLGNLARPALGHWWEFIRLLVPALADTGDEAFAKVRDLVLGRTRDDLPRAAGLDAALRETLDGATGSRCTVRLSELFERLVRYRNRELGHGSAGQRPAGFYARMARALLAGVGEVLGRVDLLAGRQLVYVEDVSRRRSGSWHVEWLELTGDSGRRIDPLELSVSDAAQLPCPGLVYLASAERGAAGDSPARRLVPLEPLLVYDPEAGEVLFLNGRRGRQRTEYLCYSSGRLLERAEAADGVRQRLARALALPAGTAPAAAAEPAAAPVAAPAADAGLEARVVGEFELLSELGRGGMGVVYRAWQPSLGRQVALKCLLGNGDARAEARFGREIRALGRVDHPNLVKIFTSGAADGQWFYAMELIEGATLAAVCARLQGRRSPAADLDPDTWQQALSTACEESRKAEKPLPASSAGQAAGPAAPHRGADASRTPTSRRSRITHIVDLVRQAAEAAHALHEAGVVHRDIKPGNILVTPDGGHAVLMDLGLAHLADDGEAGLTRTRQFVGTLRYASPEQVHSAGRLDRRSDIYSLGATLWELLALRPFGNVGEQTPTYEVEKWIMFGEPERLRKVNHQVPADLEAIVGKCLEKEPARRYQTARQLADDLQRFLGGEPVRARPVGTLRRGLRAARRRPGRVLGAVAGLLALALAAAGAWFWDAHYRLKVEYYATFAERWGVMEGVGRLSAEQARHRYYTYKFYRRGGQVEKVEIVNGQGQLTTRYAPDSFLQGRADRGKARRQECRYEFRRDAHGQLEEEVASDPSGDVVWVLHFTAPTTAHYTDPSGFPRSRTDSGAAYVQFEWSDEGFPREVRYFDRNRAPQPDADGSFGVRNEFDARGLVVRSTNLGLDGQPQPDKDGCTVCTLVRDDRGAVIARTCGDANGQPVLGKDGVAGWTAAYDPNGNSVSQSYRGTDGSPALHKNGYARVAWQYDDHGDILAEAYFGTDDRPAVHKDGYARVAWQYDDRGDPVEVAFFGLDGKPAASAEGHARWTAQPDERGNRLETKYDVSGNPIEKAFFTPDDRPTLGEGGYARWTAHYDGHGNRLTTKYDERGHDIEEAYEGPDGRLVLGPDGYARLTMRYDERGNEIEDACWGPDDKPVLHRDGYARLVAEYDAQGRPTEYTCLGLDGQPRANAWGYARVLMRYDEHGNEVETRYLGADGKLTQGVKGYARVVRTFDDRGNLRETTYYDVDGNQVHPQVVVAGVSTGSQAEQIGLQAGDVLLSHAGNPVTSAVHFTAGQKARRGGSGPEEWRVRRNGRVLAFQVPRGALGLRVDDRVVRD